MRRRAWLVGAVGAWLARGRAAAARAAARRPLVAAHRGGALLWPENSLTAFRNAIALGCDALEFDLHQTADGEVVVHHDATLERTTTGTGAVSAARRADLAALRLRARDGAVTGDRVPTLAQALDLAAPSTVELVPEIKLGAERRRYDGIEEQVVGHLRTHGVVARSTVQSFDGPTLERLRALAPALRTMLLVAPALVERRRAAAADAVRWTTELGATDLGIGHRLLDAAVVAAARRANVRVAVWTVNEAADIERVIALGADMVMSDRPDLALRLAGR